MANYTYTYARENLAKVMERLVSERDVAVITRRGYEAVAMLPADELRSLEETAYLMRSPANAARLISALGDSLDLSVGKDTSMQLDRLNAAVTAAAKRRRKRKQPK